MLGLEKMDWIVITMVAVMAIAVLRAFLSKGAILTWAGGGGGRPSLAPGEEWLLRISPPQNGGIGGTMAL